MTSRSVLFILTPTPQVSLVVLASPSGFQSALNSLSPQGLVTPFTVL